MTTSTLPIGADPEQTHEDSCQCLTFYLLDEVFGIDIRSVREIIQTSHVTHVPLAPDFIHGVINLRGSVVPVIDLKVRFGWPQVDPGPRTCILICEASSDGESLILGLMVDAVSEVVEIQAHDIEEPPPFGTLVKREYLSGLGRLGKKFIPILAPQRALDVEEMAGATPTAL